MIVVERQMQKVRPGKWPELEEIDKKYNAVESRLGFPTKRRYRCYFGGHDINTLIIERQWDGLAVMETTYERAFADSEWQGLEALSTSIIESVQFELYAPLP